MDPTAAYARLNDAVRNLDVTRGAEERYVDEVVDAWRALNDWLRDGGFPPAQWGNLRTEDAVEAIQRELEPNPWRGPRWAGSLTTAEVLGAKLRGDA